MCVLHSHLVAAAENETPAAALELSARAGGKRQRLREGGAAAGATATAAAEAATPADTEGPKKKPRPFPPPLPGFYGDGSGGGGGSGRRASAAGVPPPRSRGLAPSSSTSVSVPILTSLDCEFIQLSAEAARLFDAAADGALGGAPERAELFAFKQLVEVDGAAAGAASAPPTSGAVRPSKAQAPVSRSLLEKVEVDVDRIPNATSSSATRNLREQEEGGEARGNPARAEGEPPAFLTLGGRGWARVAELLGLAPGAAVRFERDPRTGFVHASRAATCL